MKPTIAEQMLEWSGINALLYYGPTLMKHLGMEDETGTLVVAGGISIVQLIAVFPVILYIDRLGIVLSFTILLCAY